MVRNTNQAIGVSLTALEENFCVVKPKGLFSEADLSLTLYILINLNYCLPLSRSIPLVANWQTHRGFCNFVIIKITLEKRKEEEMVFKVANKDNDLDIWWKLKNIKPNITQRSQGKVFKMHDLRVFFLREKGEEFIL